MKRLISAILLCSFTLACAQGNPMVEIKTSKGLITLELDAENSPATVANFLSYVDSESYDGTIFHRVISGFMIQGGGYYADLTEAEAGETIRNEADNGLKNLQGSIAMARTNIIDSAARQFFINVNDNGSLDHSAQSCTRDDEKKQLAATNKGLYKPVTCKTFGYTVFGRVVAGMEVVKSIENVVTAPLKGHKNVPVENIFIETISRVN